MKRILVLFAHPSLSRSRVQSALADAARSVEGVTFHDLYEAYPDYYIRVQREQALLAEHDVVVLQHPFYWYSTPAILKQWQDLVLQHGWAYGEKGRALEGKWWMHALSTGGTEVSYTRTGMHGHGVRDFLAPLERTAALCRMTFLPPYVVHGSFGIQDPELAVHVEGYRRLLTALRHERLQSRDLLAQDTLTSEHALLAAPY